MEGSRIWDVQSSRHSQAIASGSGDGIIKVFRYMSCSWIHDIMIGISWVMRMNVPFNVLPIYLFLSDYENDR
jgi:hypothetical protein